MICKNLSNRYGEARLNLGRPADSDLNKETIQHENRERIMEKEEIDLPAKQNRLQEETLFYSAKLSV